MKTLLVLRGMPACGKTTYAKSLPHKRVNRDEIRWMLHPNGYEFNKDTERLVSEIEEATVRYALNGGWDVVVDATNLRGDTMKKWHLLAASIGDVQLHEHVFSTTREECTIRNAARRGAARVPDDAMNRMYQQWKNLVPWHSSTTVYPATVAFTAAQDVNLPKAIICDLDGTLCNLNGRNPYDASTCDKDLPNHHVLTLVTTALNDGIDILFVSGREDKYKPQTETFLGQHGFPNTWCKLFMRATGDTRKDSIVKRELYEQNIRDKYFVEFVVDDRPSVVRMWRYELGLPTFAVNDKEF